MSTPVIDVLAMIAKMLLEDDRADDRWLYDAVRALVDRAFLEGREATHRRLGVVPLDAAHGRFEVRACFGGRAAGAWISLFVMDELEFTYEAFLDAMPNALADA